MNKYAEEIFDSLYYKRKVLGAGSYGTVWSCQTLEKMPKTVAVKIFRKEEYNIIIESGWLIEASTLRTLSHPNITETLDIQMGFMHFSYICLPYYTINLYNWLNGNDRKQWSDLIALQITDGIAYAHSQGIMHRDLKSENIMINMIDNIPVVKIIDWGTAKLITGLALNFDGTVQSLHYRAPEILLGATEYTEKIDIWSLGCILAELWLEEILWPGTNEDQQLRMIFLKLTTPTRSSWPDALLLPNFDKLHGIKNNRLDPMAPINYDAGLTVTQNRLLGKILVANPDDRISAAEIRDGLTTRCNSNSLDKLRTLLLLNNCAPRESTHRIHSDWFEKLGPEAKEQRAYWIDAAFALNIGSISTFTLACSLLDRYFYHTGSIPVMSELKKTVCAALCIATTVHQAYWHLNRDLTEFMDNVENVEDEICDICHDIIIMLDYDVMYLTLGDSFAEEMCGDTPVEWLETLILVAMYLPTSITESYLNSCDSIRMLLEGYLMGNTNYSKKVPKYQELYQMSEEIINLECAKCYLPTTMLRILDNQILAGNPINV